MYDRLFTSAGFQIVPNTYVNYDNVDKNNSIYLCIAYYTISCFEVNCQFWTYYVTIAGQVGQF